MGYVIVLGSERDYHAQHIHQACLKQGIEARLFDTGLYPQQHCISYIPDSGQGILHLNKDSIPFDHIQSVFWSSLCPTHKMNESAGSHSMIACHDAYTMLRCFLQEQQFLWANSWWGYDFHRVKPRQLTLARRLGVTIPATYTGNDPNTAKRFIETHQKIVFKPVYGGAHTALVTREMAGFSHLESVLKQSPVTLQAFIEGTNVRTYCIADKVFSARIKSDKIDFRCEPDTLPEACNTPVEIIRMSRMITKQFGLAWTAIDWRVSPQGEYYFLEANPSPMFIHFEQNTGYPITECLVDLLVSKKSMAGAMSAFTVNKSCLLSAN